MIIRNADMTRTVRNEMRGGKLHVDQVILSEVLPAHTRLFSTLTLIPGASIGYHVHENETELFYFISGNGIVHDDDQAVEVHAGDVMSTGSGHGHSVENTGDTDLVMLAVIITE
ncbi:MAG: cupin domain-containing protein [Clostridia bacterium]|nr:cupin domain-containing protein [Clostridia bacterium]